MLVFYYQPRGTGIVPGTKKRIYGYLMGEVWRGFNPRPVCIDWDTFKNNNNLFVTANYTPELVKELYGTTLDFTFNYYEVWLMEKLDLWKIAKAFGLINEKNLQKKSKNSINLINKNFANISKNALKRQVRDYIKFEEHKRIGYKI